MTLRLIPPGPRGKCFVIRGRVNGTLIERSTKTLDRALAEQRLREAEGALAEVPETDELIVRARKRDGVGCIYFAVSDDGLVKIGFSINPRQRLRALQTGSGTVLRIIATIPAWPEEEKQLHIRFAAYHANGEWFRFEGKLRSYVRKLVASRRSPTFSRGVGGVVVSVSDLAQ